LILLVAVAGFCLASEGPPNATRLLSAILGISLLAAGIFALNQYLERDVDAVMRRTESRPLPTGRLQPGQALWFGIILSVLSVLSLALFANWLSGMIALFTLLSYLFLYTPLKTRSSLCTLVGALPGAVPPLLGWVAARGTVGFEAGVLFSILFLWQFPHFLAIGWLYREDYARAGIRMLPVIEPEGKMTGRQIVACALILLPVSLIPALSGLSGSVYFGGALVLGLWFLYVSIRLAVLKTKWEARRLLLASVLYLPLLFGLMVLNPNDLEVGWRNRKMEARSVSQRMGEATISNVRSIILSLAKEE
jgi:protoheme IX farnesyltransferase